MIKYYPYKSDKPNKKYYIITNDNKKFILVPVIILTLQYIKMKQENKDILIDIRRMRIGMIKIQQGLGRAGWYGIFQL
jgi:hypothetical protein